MVAWTSWRRYVSPVVAAMIGVTVVVTLYAAIDFRSGGRVYRSLALIPNLVWQGELWRLVTWAFVETGAKALLLGCVALYWFGGDLAARWGQRRLLLHVATIVLVASGGTALAALVAPRVGWYPHLGGWPLAEALLITWALEFPERRIVLYGVIVLGGPVLAYGTFGFVVLLAVFAGLAPVLPALLAGGAALLLRDDVRRAFARRRVRAFAGGRPRGPYAPS